MTHREKFLKNEDGSATPLAIGLTVVFIILGGLAVDFNKAMGERTQLQMAADSAAHAALYTWEFEDTQASTDTAMATIYGMLPDVAFGDALQSTDIEFGFWNPEAASFTADPGFVEEKDSPLLSAVRAVAELEPERNNESRNIFLSIVGHDTFTIRVSSTYASYYPPCFTEGFVANDVVDMQSGSVYLDGFCLHSNEYVSLNQNNFFEPGTVVSMPNLSDLDIPESGFEKNEGLQAALRTGKYRMRILRQLPMMFASLRNGSAEHAGFGGVTESDDVLYPLDLSGNGNNAGVTEEELAAALAPDADPALLEALPRMSSSDTGKKNVTPLHFKPAKRIYRLECSGNGDITFSAETFSDFVLVTDCEINFSNGTILDGVLIATEANVNSSHLQIGLNDNCAPGGGSAIWTYGSFNAASDLKGYGAQIIAMGDITFTANADGLEGVSFVAGGMIDGTSNGAMGYCDGGGTENFAVAPYFRMVN
jgi:Flp pilus assembly protein TadG